MTRKKGFVIFIVFLLVAFTAFGFKVLFLDKQKDTGSLQVDSIPRVKVFLNDAEAGQTPYLGENLKPGEYKLKLQNWEATVKVSPGLLTYVSRELGVTNDDSDGQILFLERLPGNAAELAVVADPDGATVSIDSLAKGQAPLLLKDLSLGDRIITVSKSGFADQVVRAKMVAGFRLNAVVKLKKMGDAPTRSTADLIASGSGQVAAAATVSAQPQVLTKPYITVKDNPLGFLNIRSGPDSQAAIVGKAYPGDKFSLTAQADNWVKIKWPTGAGWAWRDLVVVTEY